MARSARPTPTSRRATGAGGAEPGVAWIALLRGVNVGGKNRLPMADLAALFAAAGCAEVRTYIQSGNVVFRAAPAVVADLASRLHEAIAARFALRVPVILRSATALEAIAAANPFFAAGADPATLHVVFLAATPSPAAVAALDPRRSPPDELAVRGGEVYLRLPGGVARTRFTNDYLDRALGTTSTVRNWRTVLTLRDLARGGAPGED